MSIHRRNAPSRDMMANQFSLVKKSVEHMQQIEMKEQLDMQKTAQEAEVLRSRVAQKSQQLVHCKQENLQLSQTLKDNAKNYKSLKDQMTMQRAQSEVIKLELRQQQVRQQSIETAKEMLMTENSKFKTALQTSEDSIRALVGHPHRRTCCTRMVDIATCRNSI